MENKVGGPGEIRTPIAL